jgi:predicted GH43/DUF377 family glycosyl hydrolase
MKRTIFLAFFLFGCCLNADNLDETGADYSGVDYVEETVSSDETGKQDQPLSVSDLVNLELMAQDFVLETRQIEIPPYPTAFNPSIIRWQGKILLSFRIRDMETDYANQIGLIFLDEALHPVGSAQVLNIRLSDPFCISKRQDPRLITVSDRLFIVYNNVLISHFKPEIRRMVLAEVHFDGERFDIDHSDCLRYFEDETPNRSEKNWVPFDYQGNLLLARSIAPHWILQPLLGSSVCESLAKTGKPVQWGWGHLRGGTPALLINSDEYLAFFHSSIYLPSLHSRGNTVQHYFMGAYTFSSAAPFEITRMSREPIIGKNFYLGREYKTWKPLQVVFPGGFIFDDRFIWIAYGRQDHEIWIAKLDKERLLHSLVPVQNP